MSQEARGSEVSLSVKMEATGRGGGSERQRDEVAKASQARARLYAQALVCLLFLFALQGVAQERASRKQQTYFTPMLARQIAETALQNGLDPLLVLEVMRQESAFRPHVVSPKNARGLMQLMPATALRFGISDPLDPQQAITGGCRYLRYLSDLFGQQNTPLILAAYNAGEQAVRKYRNKIPPYPETQNYVNTILSAYRQAYVLRERIAKRQGLARAASSTIAGEPSTGRKPRDRGNDASLLTMPMGTARKIATGVKQ